MAERARKRRTKPPRPHLVVRVRAGWSFARTPRRFVKEGSEPVGVRDKLPKHTRIVQQVPAMARKRARSRAEDELARSFQIVPPAGTRLSALLERVQAWPCVERAWIAPSPRPAGPGAIGPPGGR